MGLRFYRRVHVLPGLRLNVSKRGMSVSVGHRHCWYTTGTSGRRATLGFGHGLYYTKQLGASSRRTPPPAPSAIRSLLMLAVIVAGAWVAYHVATALGVS